MALGDEAGQSSRRCQNGNTVRFREYLDRNEHASLESRRTAYIGKRAQGFVAEGAASETDEVVSRNDDKRASLPALRFLMQLGTAREKFAADILDEWGEALVLETHVPPEAIFLIRQDEGEVVVDPFKLNGIRVVEKLLHPDPVERALKQIERKIIGPGVDSVNRLEVLLRQITDQPPEIFWPAFARYWPSCDDTRHLAEWLLSELWDHCGAGYWIDNLSTDLAWFHALPETFTVYRGASRERAAGVSWTTDIDVAKFFAKGHRGLLNPDPVVASATITKSAVLFATNEREESEVLLNPDDLPEFTVTPLRPLEDGR